MTETTEGGAGTETERRSWFLGASVARPDSGARESVGGTA
jgi:hypothetical protein